MRQPLWAINSSLLFIFVFGQIIFFILYQAVPRKVSMEAGNVPVVEKNVASVVNIENIYQQNDIFGTYIQAVALPKDLVETVPAIPEPPAFIPFKIPFEPQKVFIAPLAVTLRGVMYAYDHPDQSIAIIQFQDSKEEKNYRVGQLISDAQILKIYANRVLLVRSNGQQETLYLREDEAGKDLSHDTAKNISSLVIQMKDGWYHVPIDKFTTQIKTLSQCIELLDLTTVYQKGKSIGCRVGKAGKDSLASKLGLVKDDIIQQVDQLPVTDLSSRVLVFDQIVQKQVGDKVTIKINRGGNMIELKYVLVHTAAHDAKMNILKHQAAVAAPKGAKVAPVVDEQLLYDIEEQRKKILEQKVKFAPTAHQLALQERKKILDAQNRKMLAIKPVNDGLKSWSAHAKSVNSGV